MLRIAVPNKGTLAGPAAQMLCEAGYRQRSDERDLTCRDVDNEVEFFYLRPRDIATYVGSGDLDLGIPGDLLVDAGSPAGDPRLGFGRATFGSPPGRDRRRGRGAGRVGSPPRTRAWSDLADRAIVAEVIGSTARWRTQYGSGSRTRGRGRVTGTTLRQAGLTRW
jgi:ATP phosphoribosyltransferase